MNKLLILTLVLLLIPTAFALEDSIGVELASSGVIEHYGGYTIEFNEDVYLYNATLETGVTATNVYLFWVGTNVSIANVTVVDLVADFSGLNLQFNVSQEIMIMAGNPNNTSYTRQYLIDGTYPLAGTNINFTGASGITDFDGGYTFDITGTNRKNIIRIGTINYTDGSPPAPAINMTFSLINISNNNSDIKDKFYFNIQANSSDGNLTSGKVYWNGASSFDSTANTITTYDMGNTQGVTVDDEGIVYVVGGVDDTHRLLYGWNKEGVNTINISLSGMDIHGNGLSYDEREDGFWISHFDGSNVDGGNVYLINKSGDIVTYYNFSQYSTRSVLVSQAYEPESIWFMYLDNSTSDSWFQGFTRVNSSNISQVLEIVNMDPLPSRDTLAGLDFNNNMFCVGSANTNYFVYDRDGTKLLQLNGTQGGTEIEGCGFDEDGNLYTDVRGKLLYFNNSNDYQLVQSDVFNAERINVSFSNYSIRKNVSIYITASDGTTTNQSSIYSRNLILDSSGGDEPEDPEDPEDPEEELTNDEIRDEACNDSVDAMAKLLSGMSLIASALVMVLIIGTLKAMGEGDELRIKIFVSTIIGLIIAMIIMVISISLLVEVC